MEIIELEHSNFTALTRIINPTIDYKKLTADLDIFNKYKYTVDDITTTDYSGTNTASGSFYSTIKPPFGIVGPGDDPTG